MKVLSKDMKRSQRQERGVAEEFDGRVSSGSGNGWSAKNDVRTGRESFELKTTKAKQFTIRLNELKQAEKYALLDDLMMVFGIEMQGEQYFLLTYDDYMSMRHDLGWLRGSGMVLKLRVPAPDNWKKAKCLGIKTADTSDEYDPFFSETDVPEAKAFCNGSADGVVCPIRNDCLMFALTNNEKSGVWGGMSELGRRGLRKKWPLLPKSKEPRPEWQWMSTAEAVEGLSLEELLVEEPEEQDSLED